MRTNKLKGISELFFIFLKIGAFTFGGGYAMLPIIYSELCEKRSLATEPEMDKIIVISQSLPGVMAVNCATQVGYRFYGPVGAIICTIGVTLPSMLIIMLLAGLIMKYRTNPYVASAFFMIRAAVVGLITAAAFKMGRGLFRSPLQLTLLVIAIICMAAASFNPVFVIIGGGIAGLLVTRKDVASK